MSNEPSGPIIAATDLSDHGDEAVRQAQAWAQACGGRLVVVHAVADPRPMFSPMGEMQQMGQALKATRSERQRVVATHLEGLIGSPVETEVHVGSPAKVVLRAADDHGASLVVVGAGERASLEKLVLGSTAEQILRHAATDVLIARPSPSEGLVLAASDLSERSFRALEAAARRAKARNAPLLLVHALDIAHPMLAAFEPLLVVDDRTRSDLHDACRKVLEAELERTGATGAPEVIEGRPDRVIVRAAEDREASLVVIATHGRTGLSRIALGSVASAVSRKAPCSVLVVRAAP
jgi:nucleotide-binding universal stress UspA family protein